MSNNDYYKKYLKYKNKYLKLKSLIGKGANECPVSNFYNQPSAYYVDPSYYPQVECIMAQMVKKLESKIEEPFSLPEVRVYLRALHGYCNKYLLCEKVATPLNKHQCKEQLSIEKLKKWHTLMQQKWKDKIQGVNSLNHLIQTESPDFYKMVHQ